MEAPKEQSIHDLLGGEHAGGDPIMKPETAQDQQIKELLSQGYSHLNQQQPEQTAAQSKEGKENLESKLVDLSGLGGG